MGATVDLKTDRHGFLRIILGGRCRDTPGYMTFEAGSAVHRCRSTHGDKTFNPAVHVSIFSNDHFGDRRAACSDMNLSNSSWSLARRSRSRNWANSRRSSSKRLSVASRYSSKAAFPVELDPRCGVCQRLNPAFFQGANLPIQHIIFPLHIR